MAGTIKPLKLEAWDVVWG